MNRLWGRIQCFLDWHDWVEIHPHPKSTCGQTRLRCRRCREVH